MVPGGEKITGKIPEWSGDDQATPLLPMILHLRLDSEITLPCFYTIADACGTTQEEDCNDYWPITLAKNSFMLCYIRTALDAR